MTGAKASYCLCNVLYVSLSFLVVMFHVSMSESAADVCPREKALQLLRMGIKPQQKGDFFKMGCEQMILYQLAHLTKPEAKHFFEAGANLGYIGTRIFSLWSPGAGLDAVTLHSHLEREWHGSNPASTCHDGMPASVPIPLLCLDRYKHLNDFDPDLCTKVNSEVEYHAFDGSAEFVKNVSSILQRKFPEAHFDYGLAAVMQKPGGHLFFKQRNDEGGHVLPGNSGSQDGALAVPVITVDEYSREHNLELDMLKVDVEGFDLAVILGAKEQLSKHIWFLQFEWGGNKFKPGDGDPTFGDHSFTSFSDATDALEELGFSCYLTGDRYQDSRTLIQVTGCFKHKEFCEAVGSNCESLRDVPGIKPKKLSSLPGGWGRYGDMVCAHQKRNPAFAWALQAAEKRGLRMKGPSKKFLESDPEVLGKILSDLKAKNGDTLLFKEGGRHHAHQKFAHDEYGDVEG